MHFLAAVLTQGVDLSLYSDNPRSQSALLESQPPREAGFTAQPCPTFPNNDDYNTRGAQQQQSHNLSSK